MNVWFQKDPYTLKAETLQNSVSTLKQMHKHIFTKRSFSLTHLCFLSLFLALLLPSCFFFTLASLSLTFIHFLLFFHLVLLFRLIRFFPLLDFFFPLDAFPYFLLLSSSLSLSFMPPLSPHAAYNWAVMRCWKHFVLRRWQSSLAPPISPSTVVLSALLRLC